MLDEHFEEQMNDIIKQCPKSRQTMLFSATMTDQVRFIELSPVVEGGGGCGPVSK